MEHSKRWSIAIGTPDNSKKLTDTGRLRKDRHNMAIKLVDLIDRHFDLNELQDVCFDFNLDFDNLLGKRKRDKVRALVDWFEKRNTLDVLLGEVSILRPDVDWPEFPTPGELTSE